MSTPPAVPKAILDLEGIDKKLGSRVVFEGMNLRVWEGEALSIIGESGSGKSSCMKMMAGLMWPDRGTVCFRGRNLESFESREEQELRKKVSYVFQQNALFDSMSVYDNVAYALHERRELEEEAIRERVVNCLEMVGLGKDVLTRMPAELSGGMQKRVALARSIVTEPELILFDDPTGGLDPQNCARVRAMIENLRARMHLTVVMATHDMETVFAVSDRIAMLHDRTFPYVGSADDIRGLDVPEVREFMFRLEGESGG